LKTHRHLRWLLLLGLLFAASVFAVPLTEQQKIAALIHSIEVLPGAKFIRNGSSFSGKDAADHLRMKLGNAGGRVQTAEQFIRYIASGSSMSGEPYQIQLADGRKITSAAFFNEELKQLEAPPSAGSNASPGPPASASPAQK